MPGSRIRYSDRAHLAVYGPVLIGRLMPDSLCRFVHTQACGLTERRTFVHRHDRTTLTTAALQVPALAKPRVARFTLPLLSTTIVNLGIDISRHRVAQHVPRSAPAASQAFGRSYYWFPTN